MLVEPVAALKNAGSNRNMKPKADDHKGGVVAQDKNGSNRRLGSTDHNALDKRLSRNHTEPDPINSRHLLPAVPSTECVKGLLNAVKKLLEAVEQSRKKGVKSVDGLHADNAGAAAVNEAIQECNGDPDEWGVKLAATLENMVDGMIDVVKGGKSAKQALKEFSVKQLEQFDPTGIVTFGKAFVHEVCEVATVPDTYFNKPIEMDNSIEHLGLQVGGEIAVEEAKWTPHGAEKMVRVWFRNTQPYEIDLKAYSGGRLLPNPQALSGSKPRSLVSNPFSKKNKKVHLETKLSVEFPLEQVKGKVMYVDVLVKDSIFNGLHQTLKDYLNLIAAKLTFGNYGGGVKARSKKVAFVAFWVPNRDKGVIEIETAIPDNTIFETPKGIAPTQVFRDDESDAKISTQS